MVHGKEAVRMAVENAQAILTKRIKPMEEVQRVDLSKLEKIRSGIASLDKTIGGFYSGQLILSYGGTRGRKINPGFPVWDICHTAGYTTFFYSGELMDWYFRAWFDLQVAGRMHINAMSIQFWIYVLLHSRKLYTAN